MDWDAKEMMAMEEAIQELRSVEEVEALMGDREVVLLIFHRLS